MSDPVSIDAIGSALGTVGALNVLGWFIKSTPQIQNRWIPHILVASGSAIEAVTSGLSLGSIVAGGLMGIAAVGAHQLKVTTLNPPTDPPATPPTT